MNYAKTSLLINKTKEELKYFILKNHSLLGDLTQTKEYEFLVESKDQIRWRFHIEDELTGKCYLRALLLPTGDDSISVPFENKDKSLTLSLDLTLRHLKALIETGEVSSTEGQPHGDRGILGVASEIIKESFFTSDSYKKATLPFDQQHNKKDKDKI